MADSQLHSCFKVTRALWSGHPGPTNQMHLLVLKKPVYTPGRLYLHGDWVVNATLHAVTMWFWLSGWAFGSEFISGQSVHPSSSRSCHQWNRGSSSPFWGHQIHSLPPQTHTPGATRFVLTISGAESFEAKLNEAQDWLGIHPDYRVPVNYRPPYSAL